MGHEVFQYDRQTLPRSLANFSFDDFYQVPLLPVAPTLDGEVRPAEWAMAVGFDSLSHKGILEERRARAYVGATLTHLYVAIVSDLPADHDPVADVTVHSDKIVFDDAVELWIDPTPGEENGVAFQMLVNSKGVDAYLTHPRGNCKPETVYGWKGNYRIANGIHQGHWHCQIEMPLSSVAKGRQAIDGLWGINVCRDFKRPWGFASLGNRGFAPGGEIVFRFRDNDVAAVQLEHRNDPVTRRIHAVLSMNNPGPTPLDLSTQLFLKRDKMPEVSTVESVVLAPGERREAALQIDDGVSDHFDFFVRVTGQGSGQVTGREMGSESNVHYSRYYRWGPPRVRRWETHPVSVLPVDFSFAYHPYSNRMTLLADVSGLDASATLRSIDFVIRKQGSDHPLYQTRIDNSDLQNKTCKRTFVLPPLDGEYEISATSHGAGLPTEPLVKTFSRTTYDWEHAGLGTSRSVFPPFTPIAMRGNTLETVMKQYDLGPTGLLDQIRTDDQQRFGFREILAAPMRYLAIVTGVESAVVAQNSQIVSHHDDQLITAGRCGAGALQIDWTGTLDYDGMFRVDLTLLPTAGKTVDRLDLHIPIRGSVAQLLHAMADGIRYPIRTSLLPAGEGVVWDAASLVSSDYPANFATYVFLGDACRGVCWFAENDRGWSWEPATPNAEIIRSGDRVTLVVHLINKPLVIDVPRTLTFGLQASPVKPYLRGWRHRWESERFNVIGTDIHWFGLGNCASFYPAGKDLTLWHALRNSVNGLLTDDQIEATIARARPYFQARGDETVATMERLARQNLRSRLGKRIILYYNRSAYPAMEEFQTFMDEWGTEDFNHYRGAPDHFEVKIVPCESFIDFALYWYSQSFEHSPNLGVYVDNIFFHSSRNTTATNAYRRDDGTSMPSTGIWQLRELAKRTFVLLNERGMEPIHMVHLTSALILPIVSFYTIQYDWEWHFSEGDVQDRFQRDYLLAVSTGAHSGNWPIVLHEQGRCVADEWTIRTYLAVATVHELIIDPYVWDVEVISTDDTPENRLFATLRQPILELCKKPEVQVWRYWDERPLPVRTGDPLLLAIVYAIPGVEAIIAITSYLDRDATLTIKIDPIALGFSADYQVADVETGEWQSIETDSLSLAIKRHDLREFRLKPR